MPFCVSIIALGQSLEHLSGKNGELKAMRFDQFRYRSRLSPFLATTSRSESRAPGIVASARNATGNIGGANFLQHLAHNLTPPYSVTSCWAP